MTESSANRVPTELSYDEFVKCQSAKRDDAFLQELAREWSYRLRHGSIETRKGCTLQFMDPRTSKGWVESAASKNASRVPQGLTGLEGVRSVHLISRQYDEALARMLADDSRKDAYIITGEKSTGKTAVRKYLISSLLEDLRLYELKAMMLHVDAIVEFFCHAATPRNDEESFASYAFELALSHAQSPVAAQLRLLVKNRTYLLKAPHLESERGKPWRNYHALFGLVCAVPLMNDEELCKSLKVLPLDSYMLLKSTTALSDTDKREYCEKFDEFQKALEVCGVDRKTGLQILRTLSAILLLGNLEFKVRGPGSPTFVNNQGELADVCTLLGLPDANELEQIFCTTRVSPEGRSIRAKKASIRQACQRRDVLMQNLYMGIVQMLVKRINVSINKLFAASPKSTSVATPIAEASTAGSAKTNVELNGTTGGPEGTVASAAKEIIILDLRALSGASNESCGIEELFETIARERIEEVFARDMALTPSGYESVLPRLMRRITPSPVPGSTTLAELLDDCVHSETLLNDVRDEKHLTSSINLGVGQGCTMLHASTTKGVALFFPAMQLAKTFCLRSLVNDNLGLLSEDVIFLMRKSTHDLIRNIFSVAPNLVSDERSGRKVPTTTFGLFANEFLSVLRFIDGCQRFYVRCFRLATAVDADSNMCKIDVDSVVRQMNACGIQMWEKQVVSAEVGMSQLAERVPDSFREEHPDLIDEEEVLREFFRHLGLTPEDITVTSDRCVRMNNRAAQTYRTWKDALDVQKGVVKMEEIGLKNAPESAYQDESANDNEHELTHQTLNGPPTKVIDVEDVRRLFEDGPPKSPQIELPSERDSVIPAAPSSPLLPPPMRRQSLAQLVAMDLSPSAMTFDPPFPAATPADPLVHCTPIAPALRLHNDSGGPSDFPAEYLSRRRMSSRFLEFTPSSYDTKSASDAQDMLRRAAHGLAWASSTQNYDLALDLSQALKGLNAQREEARFAERVELVLGPLLSQLPDAKRMFDDLNPVSALEQVADRGKGDRAGYVGDRIPSGGSYGQLQRLYYLADKCSSREGIADAEPGMLLELVRLARQRLDHELYIPLYYQSPFVIMRLVRVLALLAKFAHPEVQASLEEFGIYDVLVAFLSFLHCNKDVLLMVALFFKTATELAENHTWFSRGHGLRLLLHSLARCISNMTGVDPAREDYLAVFCVLKTLHNLCKAKAIGEVLALSMQAQKDECIYLPRLLSSVLKLPTEEKFQIVLLRIVHYVVPVYAADHQAFVDSELTKTLVRLLASSDKDTLYLTLDCLRSILALNPQAEEALVGCTDLVLKHLLLGDAQSLFSRVAIGFALLLPYCQRCKERLHMLLPPATVALFDALTLEQNDINIKKLYAWRKEMLVPNKSKQLKELLARIELELSALQLVMALGSNNADRHDNFPPDLQLSARRSNNPVMPMDTLPFADQDLRLTGSFRPSSAPSSNGTRPSSARNKSGQQSGSIYMSETPGVF